MGITFAVFKVEGRVPVKKDILAIWNIGSLSVVLQNKRNARWLYCFFGLLISQGTSSPFVGIIKKDCSFGLLRYLGKLILSFTRSCCNFSVIKVKWLLELLAILVEFLVVLFSFWMQLISLFPLVVMLMICLMLSQVLKIFSLFFYKKILKSLVLFFLNRLE